MANIKYLIKRVFSMNYKNMFSKINHIHEITGKSRIYIFNDMRKCAVKYGAGYVDYDLYEMYNLTDEERDTYITRGRNNELVKKYNNPDFIPIFSNKAKFNEVFKDYIKRDFVYVPTSSKEEVLKFLKKHAEFMAKPINGTCGKGILKLNTHDYESLDALYDFLKEENNDYVLEELIKQSEEINQIYAGSINTLRIVTFLDKNKKAHVLSACIRIGNKGKFVDNFNNGGMVAPVDEVKGIITNKALDKEKNLYEKHPVTKTKIEGFKFKDWDKAIKLVCDAALVVPEVRYVGWDVCFSTNGPILVEGNEFPGHDLYQLPVHTPNKIGIWPKYQKILDNEKKS